MLRSMYSGIAGMKNFQQKLDVISNNIANVNTQGFKKGRPTFQDMMSQQTGAAAGADGGRGGINAKQIGLGSELGSIDTVDTQGSLQNTGRELDLAISGSGYFRLQNPEAEGGADGVDEEVYTRSGNFYLDEGGNVVNGDGYFLLDDDGAQINIPEDAQSFSIDASGNLNVVGADGFEPVAIGLATFNNPGGLDKVGGNVYSQSLNSGAPEAVNAGEGGAGDIVSGALEMSNVDLSEEFTEMITAQRGFQANTRGITTADEVLQELLNIKR